MGWLLVWVILNALFFVWRILVTSEVETRERSIRNCRKLPTSDQNVPSLVDDLGRNIQTAEPLARTSVFDLAVFDINVGGFNISPIAEIVAARGLPFVFVSGYGAAGRPVLFSDKPVLRKPFLIEHLADIIISAMGDKSTGQSYGASRT